MFNEPERKIEKQSNINFSPSQNIGVSNNRKDGKTNKALYMFLGICCLVVGCILSTFLFFAFLMHLTDELHVGVFVFYLIGCVGVFLIYLGIKKIIANSSNKHVINMNYYKNEGTNYKETEYDLYEKIDNYLYYSDELLRDTLKFYIEMGQASVSMLQRRFKIGYKRAAQLTDECDKLGILGEKDGSRPRSVLYDEYNIEKIFKAYFDKHNSNYNSNDNEIRGGIFDSDRMNGHEFEYYCAEVLLSNGFDSAEVTPGSGDQGVDIVADKDGIKYAIQCKNYASSLSNTPIQEVNAGKIYYSCHVAVVMTNSYFTPGAIDLAKATNVILWDRDRLEKMINNMQK